VSTQEGLLNDAAENESAFTTEVNAGFRVLEGLDMRAAMLFRHLQDLSNLVHIKVGARYLSPGDAKVRFVAAAQLELGFNLYDDDNLDTAIGLAVPLKAGVHYEVIPETLFLGLLAGLDIQMVQLGDPPDQDMRFGLAVPTLELAAEWRALRWLEVRTAIKGGYGIQFAGYPDPAGGDETYTPKYEQLAFSSGIGFVLGPFRVDGVIQYQLWQHGPWIIGGYQGIFAGVTAAFQWGGQGAAPDIAPAPSAAPEEASERTPESVTPPEPEKKPAATRPGPDGKADPVKDAAVKDEEKEKEGKDKAKEGGEGTFEGWEE
jgi:hypothetical protein